MSQRLVLLHGWGADADDLRTLGDALQNLHPQPLEVICLDAPDQHPETAGRQWYGLFPAQWDDVPAAVAALRQRLIQLDGGEEALSSTVLFGFSQGGAMALDCGCSLPLAGVISCSGYPHPNWKPGPDHPPVLLLHGQQDNVVPVVALEAIWSRLQRERCERVLFDEGHTIPPSVMQPLQRALQRMLPTEEPKRL